MKEGKPWYAGMTLKEMFKVYKKIYGKKEAIKHWNNYWKNVKNIEESKDVMLMQIYHKGDESG